MNELVEAIKAFCLANYEEGYDVCVECWEDADYADWIETYKVTSVRGFAMSYAFMIDHANEIRSTAF
jgi:hypothetical protein